MTISSNMGHLMVFKIFQVVKMQGDLGYYEQIDIVKWKFEQQAEDALKTSDFIEAVKHLAKKNSKYDIVFVHTPLKTLIFGNFI